MKKLMMIAVMAVAGLAASAQTWVGGTLGFETKHIQGADKNIKTLNIAPEVGYNLNDKVAVAIALGYTFDSNFEVQGDVYDYNEYSINPYLRYTLAKAGDFSVFVDGGAKVAFGHLNGAKTNASFVGVNVRPGISYAVSPKVTLVAHTGDGVYYGHTWMKNDGNTFYRENKFGFEIFNGINFGAYVNF